MRLAILSFALWLCACGGTGGGNPPPPPPPNNEPVWIVAGQSNAIWSEPFTGIQVRALTTSGIVTYTTGDYPGVAVRFAMHRGGDPLIAPVGIGGTPLSCWQVDGECFASMRFLEGRQIAGVIFWQGEADANWPALAAAYDVELNRLIADWRAYFRQDLNFFIVQLETFAPESDATPERWQRVQDAQLSVAMSDPRAELVVSRDITYGHLHPVYAYDEIGRRLAAATLAASP